MKLIVCLCICFLLVASSSHVPISDRCPIQCPPPDEDADAMVFSQAAGFGGEHDHGGRRLAPGGVRELQEAQPGRTQSSASLAT
ncbi:hypothetical protein HU200_005779 [Digitaria exilis]|uniref:Uncharacterized protein n=1 Tax=Digitaria exilis TaxID=1010633 RepID=A0A835FSH7_9POAL|nr:hypothetical protein HU200_005779 [Digitaria exilis]